MDSNAHDAHNGRQLFPRSADAIVKWSIAVGGTGLVAFAAVAYEGYRSDWWQRRNEAPDQPVLFSHRHHADELRIDCRFCHATVERSAFAGMPATDTCMTCHSGVFTDSPMLKPVLDSARTGRPMDWVRVYDVADYVYFNHGIHVNKGIGCTTCHGDIGQQRLTRKARPLYMSWCIECHRSPGKFLRRPGEIYSSDAPKQTELDRVERLQLVHTLGITTKGLTDCTTCHR